MAHLLRTHHVAALITHHTSGRLVLWAAEESSVDPREGLAVLAEYLVGGLSRHRMRILAARVVAARQLLDGASFIDTFRTLDRNYEFSQRTAYTVTMRIYRGGGLTKDAVYLRGLLQILRYLREDGQFEALTEGGDVYLSPTAIITAGGTPVKLGVPGELEFAGKGVSYCAICDGAFFKQQVIAVVGGGDAAAAIGHDAVGCRDAGLLARQTQQPRWDRDLLRHMTN